MEAPFWFPAAVAGVAFLYAIVGHGGASGYLAAGALAGLVPEGLRLQALALNLAVAGIAGWSFRREGHLKPGLLWPLAVASVPAAFLGARLALPTHTLKALLGAMLLLAALRLAWDAWHGEVSAGDPRVVAPWLLALVGAPLGLLAGLTGVGGGIFLSPLLIVAGWASVKQTSAVSAWFIWLNSAAGLLGAASAGAHLALPWTWLAAAVAGGLLGARLGARRFGAPGLKAALAAVLALASAKLLGGS